MIVTTRAPIECGFCAEGRRKTRIAELEKELDLAVQKLDAARAEERERCAKVCESMVVGGRAWTPGQGAAADALFDAASNIRDPAVKP